MRKLSNDELNRLSVEEFKKAEKIPVIVVLDNVRSMHNVGSVFRTADAFLIQEIHLCGITARPPHPEIHKTALGATETVVWRYFESIEDSLKHLSENEYILIGIEQTAESITLQHFRPVKQSRYAVIFGHEVRGVQQKVIDQCEYSVEIPQQGTKHSLNISVCAGIVLWHFFQAFE